jgi:anaphase-promoting complex subunit 4
VLNSGDTGLADENEEAIQAFSSVSFQHFNSVFWNIFNSMSSGDKDGCICFNIFEIFPVEKIASKHH